jgi:hypothetical protein
MQSGSGGTPPAPVGYQPPSLPGVAPGSTSGIVLARQVIVSGPNGGVFIYDIAGNLRVAEVGGTTPDPRQGITCFAGISTFNGAGACLSIESTDATTPGKFEYANTGTSSQGTLISSTCPVGGLDPFGNLALSGTTTYRLFTGPVFIALNMDPSLSTAVTFFSAATMAGPWTQQGTFSGNNAGVLAMLASDNTSVEVDPGGQVQFTPGGISQLLVRLNNGTGGFYLQPSLNVGRAKVIPDDDGLTYNFGQSLRIVGSNTLINSTTPITLMSWANQGPSYYYLNAHIPFSSAASGTIQPMDIRLLGTSTLDICQIDADLTQYQLNAPFQVGQITAKNSDPSASPNLGNSGNYRWMLDGFMHVSGAGSLVIAARQGTSAANETFTVSGTAWAVLTPM